jgi:hypothetical protein
MKVTLTRHGNLIIQSESEIEDYALENFVGRNEQVFGNTPCLFCFDHSTDFNTLVAQMNKESESAKSNAIAQKQLEQEVAAANDKAARKA